MVIDGHPLVMTNIANKNGHGNDVSFPVKMVMFYCSVALPESKQKLGFNMI